MKIVFRYLKPFTVLVAFCLVLLFGQAVGELTLPNLMSDIVNTGLQGGGITETLPRQLSGKALITLTRFMTEQDAERFAKAYTPKDAGSDLPEAEQVFLLQAPADDAALSAIFGRTGYFILNEAMTYVKTLQEQGQVIPRNMDADDLSPAVFYEFAGMLMLQPDGIAAELAKPQAAMDPMLYAQVGKSLIKVFYDDLNQNYGVAELNTQKLQREYIYATGAKMLLLALGCGLAAVTVGLLSARVSSGLSRNLRRAVFERVQRFSKAEIDRFSTASLITRSTNDVRQVEMLTLMGIRMLAFAPVMGIGGLIMALRKSVDLSWIIALAVLVLVLVLATVLLVVLPKFKSLQGLIDKLNLVARENLTGLMVIRAYGNEAHEAQRFEQSAENLRKTERFVYCSMATLMPLLQLLMQGMSMLIIWFGGKAIENSTLQIGDMMAFVQYSMHIVFSFLFVAMMFVMLPRASVSANRIKEVLSTEVTVNDAPDALPFPEGRITISFENVDFRYAQAEEDVLSGISFTAKPGQTTAFIGATGSGKTTLMNLLERFYDVTGGAIKINGADIRSIPQSDLRRHIGFVPQKEVLFSGDIRSNVAYGDEAMADATVRKAIEVAQAENFVAETEGGLQAHVAQAGANFSGGQKQRLSIARSLARNPRVYIFDDSFSALDYKTDAALRRALKAYTADATVFIVAQRISTILQAEQIIALDDGKIVGIGTHKELLQTCEIYREIAESQLSKEELA
ncbi:MAG: ABC transporter ATP-binding protein/permease [Oscillospiraceae bacterium]|jgi:ATP-binding cassette subfamily B protein|nr:ABC transporter ATP-binding protein/permease [Oscillospiraceae bacterium]